MVMSETRGQGSERALGLGIDTGGTFTDAAVVDMGSKQVLSKAKSPTTYHDLSIGLMAAVDHALEGEGFERSEIRLVGLSTTLATNSLLQGKGGSVGLIGIGWEPAEGWDLGAKRARFIKGGHDMRGRPLQPLNESEAMEAVREASIDMDAMVVSSFFGVVNPVHEETVRRMIKETVGIPVVAGHDLTMELGILERTVTAVLNARLLPIVNQFLGSVERALLGKGISAPIMVFKGDGTLMNLSSARERPVETILSGPAASLMGGLALAKQENCIVLDIGGTSTDIAFLDAGFPRMSKEGATVGNWRTMVRAIDIWTASLGGDSRIDFAAGRMTFGPERVLPLAMACASSPELLGRLRLGEAIEYLVAYPRDPSALPQGEREVFEHLRDFGPMTLQQAVDGIEGIYLTGDYIHRLKERSYLISTGLTPTDVLNVAGTYRSGAEEASRLGVEYLAALHGLGREELIQTCMGRMRERVAEEVLRKTIADVSGETCSSKTMVTLIDMMTGAGASQRLALNARLDRPIIGIGAPALAYVTPVEPILGTKVIVPKDHDVGNAVGAVCSMVSESIEVQIHKMGLKYFVYLPGQEPLETDRLEPALFAAKEGAEAYVRERVRNAGGKEIVSMVEVEMRKCRTGVRTVRETLNWVEVKARASGKPSMVADMTKG
jgi:N-methylhydantoinase A/oxoprolinase/acetone carboxylase beta subunit